MTGVEWSPDGRQIVGLWDSGKGAWPPTTELDVFDVYAITTAS
jgi:hypothetical protein